jgi:hypothetical protein
MSKSTSIRALAAVLGMALAAPAAAQARGAPPPPPREETDGEKAVGKWGLAFFGVQTLSFGTFNTAPNTVDVYTIGVRRWMQPSPGSTKIWGFDAGLGLVTGNRTHEAPVAGAPVTYKASALGLSLHLGLPVALARGRHITFLALPEGNVLYATGGNDYPGPGRTQWKGYGFDVGARAGFELFFGFLGMPQFALEGTVGVALHYSAATGKLGNAETKDSSWTFGTDKPLGFVTGNIAAIYYY